MLSDWDEIAEELAKASRKAFDETRAAHEDETFFAYVLMTYDDANSVGACMNSVENHRSMMEEYGIDSPSADADHFCWTPAEWGQHEFVGNAHFAEVDKRIAEESKKAGPDGFAAHKESLLTAMYQALTALESEAFWGKGDARAAVTVFVTLYDSALAEEVEDLSAKMLNPAATYDRFAKRFAEQERFAREEAEQKAARQAAAGSGPAEAQAAHWIAVLDKLVAKPPEDTSTWFTTYTEPVEFAVALGRPAIPALLAFIGRHLEREEPYVGSVRFSAIEALTEIGHADPAIHAELLSLLERSCSHNERREKWLMTPFHLARCLRGLFQGYPEPEFDKVHGTQALLDHRTWIEQGQRLLAGE